MQMFIFICFLLILLMIVKSYISSRISKRKHPPGPNPLPIVGNLLDLGDKPHKSLAKLSEKYGPVMSLKLGQITTIVISSSTAAKEIFQTHDKIFSNRVAPHAIQAYNHGEIAMSWIPSASSLWKNLRKISKSQIFSGKVLDANMSVRHAKVQNLLHELEKCGQTGEAVDIRKVSKTSLNFLSSSFFSVDTAISASNDDKDDGFAREIKETVWGLIEEAGKTNVAEFFPLLKRLDPQGIRRRGKVLMRRFMDVLDLLMNRKLRLRATNGSNCGEDDDVLDVLIDMMMFDKNNNNNNTEHSLLDRNTIQHLLLALFLAGTETTSSTLEWSMAELLRNPDILSKAQEEVNRVIGKGNQVKESDVTRLPYLQCIVKETLRLHPPLPVVPREAGSDVEVNGYKVPKGSKVFVNVWAIGRDSSVWENPEKFDPERFLGSNIDVRARNYEFVPFGGGRRICPGLPMAMRVLQLMLGSLILSFGWKLENGVSPETLDMDEEFGLTLHRANPLQAIPILC